jgi:hypothetical protein
LNEWLAVLVAIAAALLVYSTTRTRRAMMVK